MSKLISRFSAVALAATIALGVNISSASSAPANPNYGKVYKYVWVNYAPTHGYSYNELTPPYRWGPPTHDGAPAMGFLYAGSNYFYCQALGGRVYYGSYYNKWWLLTDDDAGNVSVWLNAVYIGEGANDQAISGVPFC